MKWRTFQVPRRLPGTPGPAGTDEDGNHYFDCGCFLIASHQHRCPLHRAAPALVAACEAIVLTDQKRAGITVNPHELYTKAVTLARAALALAKGE